MKKYKVVDLFSGVGGLSLGLSFTGRFETVLAWDVFKEALDTFASWHSPDTTATIDTDIRHRTEAKLVDALSKVGVKIGDIDIVVGGPPCEGFSQNRSLNSGGDWRTGGATRVTKFIDDPRNELFKYFLDVVRFLQPKVFVIENVPALIRHKDGETIREIFAILNGMGYTAKAKVLNAANYGVPQLRRRAFILAQRKRDFEDCGLQIEWPSQSHWPFTLASAELDADQDWLPGDAGYWPSVWEAIGDLPAPIASSRVNRELTGEYAAPANSELRRFLRQKTSGGITHHLARALGDGGLARVQALKPRQCAHDLPEALKPKSYFHYSYSRLVWADPARTITKFAYYVGSGMFAHPEQDRGITMREAARLQTFPDHFSFLAGQIRPLSAMIGNAVPPLLARRIGLQLVHYLDSLAFWQTRRGDGLRRGQRTDAVLRRMESQAWDSTSVSRQQILGLKVASDVDDDPDIEEEDSEIGGATMQDG